MPLLFLPLASYNPASFLHSLELIVFISQIDVVLCENLPFLVTLGRTISILIYRNDEQSVGANCATFYLEDPMSLYLC